jgi:tRNA (cmo5U34)-methyltransferase
VGAGAGALSLEILGVYPNAQIVCQDFSEIMLGHARQRLGQFSDRVTFVKSDLRRPAWLRTIEEPFDAVVSSLVFHTVPTRIREIYGEIFPVVKAGGCFLSGDHVAPPGPAVGRVYYKAQLTAYQAMVKAETGLEKSLSEVEQELRERRRLRRVSSSNRPEGISGRAATLALANHLEWLRQAGFDEVDCLWKDMRRTIIGGFRHGK